MDSKAFFEVSEIADVQRYLVHDSNNRFLGGIWTAFGLALFLGLTNLKKYQSILNFIFAAIFLGGLARFSQMNLEITFGPDLIVVVLIELVGMPILYIWLSKTVKQIV